MKESVPFTIQASSDGQQISIVTSRNIGHSQDITPYRNVRIGAQTKANVFKLIGTIADHAMDMLLATQLHAAIPANLVDHFS